MCSFEALRGASSSPGSSNLFLSPLNNYMLLSLRDITDPTWTQNTQAVSIGGSLPTQGTFSKCAHYILLHGLYCQLIPQGDGDYHDHFF